MDSMIINSHVPISQHKQTTQQFFFCRAKIYTIKWGDVAQSQTWNLQPCGHLQCVITPGSRRDNTHSQLSSYTQVCRHGRMSADLRTQRVAPSFLTRGWWQRGNLQFSLKVFSSLPCGQSCSQGLVPRPQTHCLVLTQTPYFYMDWVTGHNRRLKIDTAGWD